MSDRKRAIRDWIENLAAPISAEEAIRRASRSSQRPEGKERSWTTALLAGGVTLLVIGLPLLLLRPQSEPRTAPESTTSPAVTPTWEGLGIEEVRADAARIGIVLHEEQAVTDDVAPGTVVRQEPAPGQILRDGDRVVVAIAESPPDDVSTTSQPRATETCRLPKQFPQPGQRYVNVFYGCRHNGGETVQPVLRAVPTDSAPWEETAYRALLAGPSADEGEAGIQSRFDEETAGMLESVTFEDGEVSVDLRPSIDEVSPSASDITALLATGFQFETTARLGFTIDGDCEAFRRWSGTACLFEAETWWHETSKQMIAGWPSVVVRPERVTGSCEMSPPDPGPEETLISVLHSCAGEEDGLLDFTPVPRLVPAGSDRFASTLTELVRGPSGAELASGISPSFLSERTARMVDAVTMDGTRLIVDFHRFVRSPAISNISTSTGGTVFNTVLNANLFQYPGIEEIEYRVNGSCDAYWGFFEAICSIQTRENHERALDELS